MTDENNTNKDGVPGTESDKPRNIPLDFEHSESEIESEKDAENIENSNSSDDSLNDPENMEEYGTRYHIEYPKLIKRFGVWPVNVGLFFFYNNVVSLVVLLVGLLIMHSNGVSDPRLINEKLGGLSVISSLITLGLTIIYSKKFYFTRN
jgi:hypothetical protein